jgi:hypothetical protein
MSLNVGDQEYNGGKKYRQKGTLCGPNICQCVNSKMLAPRVLKPLSVSKSSTLTLTSNPPVETLPNSQSKIETCEGLITRGMGD